MVTLSKTATKSLKTHGAYQCKAPKVPYVAIVTNSMATCTYNELYLMGFVRGLNEGFKVWRDESGRVTSNFSHGGSWVHAEVGEDGAVRVFMVGLGEVGYIVRADHDDAIFAHDFTSDQSDSLGFWINHEGKSTCPPEWVKYDINA